MIAKECIAILNYALSISTRNSRKAEHLDKKIARESKALHYTNYHRLS